MLAGVAALAILVIGCGEGEENLTKAEFIKQSDVICAKGQKEVLNAYLPIGKEKEEEKKPLTVAEQIKFGEEFYFPSVEKRVEEIRDLNPPSDEEEQVEAILTAVEEAMAAVKKKPALALNLNRNPFNKKPKKLAEAYGFKVCGIG
jgi:hypothetical protein